MMERGKAVVLADCDPAEIEDFVCGLKESTGIDWAVESRISNWGRSSRLADLRRYAAYFTEPFRVFLHRKDYRLIIGWQQFYALNFAFWCALFRVPKTASLFAASFTYKEKPGLIGRVYEAFMRFILRSPYLDRAIVYSRSYIESLVRSFAIPEERFAAIPFGVPDPLGFYTGPVRDGGYALAIGRSNRDYRWLVEEWPEDALPLTIISDTFAPDGPLPGNIRVLSDVSGDAQWPYIAECSLMVLPIDDPLVCSGDTVLLNALAFGKNVIVTVPSALADFYIEDGVNAFTCSKDAGALEAALRDVLARGSADNPGARSSFTENFTRRALGLRFGRIVSQTLGEAPADVPEDPSR